MYIGSKEYASKTLLHFQAILSTFYGNTPKPFLQISLIDLQFYSLKVTSKQCSTPFLQLELYAVAKYVIIFKVAAC